MNVYGDLEKVQFLLCFYQSKHASFVACISHSSINMPAADPCEMSGGLHPYSVIPPKGPSSAKSADATYLSRDKSQQNASPSAPNAPPSQPQPPQNAEDPPIRTSSMRPPEQPSPVTAHRPTQKEFDEFSKRVCARVWKTNLSKLFDKVVQAVHLPPLLSLQH